MWSGFGKVVALECKSLGFFEIYSRFKFYFTFFVVSTSTAAFKQKVAKIVI